MPGGLLEWWVPGDQGRLSGIEATAGLDDTQQAASAQFAGEPACCFSTTDTSAIVCLPGVDLWQGHVGQSVHAACEHVCSLFQPVEKLNRPTWRGLYLPAAVHAEQLTAVNRQLAGMVSLLNTSQPFLTSIAANRLCANKGVVEGCKGCCVSLTAEIDGHTSNCKSCIIKNHAANLPSHNGCIIAGCQLGKPAFAA